MSVDWPSALTRAKQNAGDWVLAGTNVPRSAMVTAKRRSNLILRALEHPLEARMTGVEGTPARGDLYIRYLGPREESQEGPQFRTVIVSQALKARVRRHAEAQNTTMTALVEEACRRIAQRGSLRTPEEKSTTLNLSVDREAWEAALARSQADGFVLSEAIRLELERIAISRRR